MADSNEIKKQQRIIYVEPNDVFDKEAENAQQGLSLTPKYEDFCISFNLIIEAFTRFKTDATSNGIGGNGNTQKFSIQWGLTKEDMYKRRTSVLQGNRGNNVLVNEDGSYGYSDSNYNYLTTYYTDLTFDSYKDKTQIEGLGVESVQVSYESWYTPTVTIKFVDLRGSAIFGREEATHVDEKLTAENIFGCFFTMPYPLFRLQVKGFLGKPVTYQLTCSGFKGEFNSQTGNFEAVATFIGYSWSLMTDIPFTYLIAAPYAPYIGSEYWNRNRTEARWGLWDDGNTLRPPMRLYDLFLNIKAALAGGDYGKATEEQSAELNSMSNERKELNILSEYLNLFIKSLREKVDGKCLVTYDEEAQNEQLLLFSDSNSLTLTEEIIKNYEDFYNALTTYTTSGYDKSKEINTNIAPNKWDKCPQNITFLDKFTITTDTEGNSMSIHVNDVSEVTVESLQTVVFNEVNGQNKLTNSMANIIFENITGDYRNTNIKKYAYLLNCNNITRLITDRLKEIEKREEQILIEINENINLNIIQLLSTKSGDVSQNDGFKPFIGNVFKLIFCHLETFCHIMFDSAEEIYTQMNSGYRRPEMLGIDMKDTDIKKGVNENVSPWPAIFNHGIETSECGHKSDQSEIYGWVGDLSTHRFIEEKVVYSLQEGIQKIMPENNSDNVSEKFNGFPILPSDFCMNNNVFGAAPLNDVSELSGHLATRIANILGVTCGNNITSDLSKTIGKLDAYNLYRRLGSITSLSTLMKNISDRILEGIMYCENNEEYQNYAKQSFPGNPNLKHYGFETRKIKYSKEGRQPYFIDNGNNAVYVHFYDKNSLNYTPCTLRDFMYYANRPSNGDFTYNGTSIEDAYFTPNTKTNSDGQLESYDWLYISDSSKIDEIKQAKEQYVNKYMFNIVTDDSIVNSIKNKYLQLKGGNLKLGEYEVKDDLTEYINKFIKVGDQYKSKFFKNVWYMLSGNSEKLGLLKQNFLPDDNNNSKTPDKLNYFDWYENKSSNIKNSVKVNEDGELFLNDEKTNLSELVIQQFKVEYLGNECNIFGCPFYYMQGEKLSGETDEQFAYRSNRVKALLFLHTFKYDYIGTNLNVFDRNKRNGLIEEVPKGYLLFLGAMLWRKRYYNNIGKDPIIFSHGNEKYASCSTDYTLFTSFGTYVKFFIYKQNAKYNYAVNNLFDGMNNIDYNIENQLIALFENFAKTTFNSISKRYELIDLENGKESRYTLSGLKKDIGIICNFFKNEGNGKQITVTSPPILPWNVESTPSNFINWLNRYGFKGWLGRYSLISVYPSTDANVQGLRLMFNEKDEQYQNIFKDLYFNSYIVTDSCYRRMGKNTEAVNENDKIKVNKTLLKAYLSGFKSACDILIGEETVSIGGTEGIAVSRGTLKNRDVSLAIYYYLKNLWDKWLVIADTKSFDVDEFFMKNFVFIDSFYKNTYHLLAINCQKLLEAWTQLADNGSLFHFLSKIVSDHGCIFMPVPDYIGFNGNTQQEDIKAMEDLFRPMPYNSIEAPSNNNKFVVIYTHSPSHIKTEDNGYKPDSFDIWSHELKRPSDEAIDRFKTTNDLDFDRTLDIATREGYNVPSFGVSFARQNNHIFKNLRLTMDNPVMTEQAIKAMSNIALKGSSSTHSIQFIGQDTFNVFTNYSYSVDVEMMGNAQICPLMYFQLTNVPMWRGTYMIYKVIHNMTPGNMTTTVTAMKLNKYAQPFNTSFFVVHELPPRNNNDSSLESDCEDTNDSTDTVNNDTDNGVTTSGVSVQNSNLYEHLLPSTNVKSVDGKFKVGEAFRIIYNMNYADINGNVIGNLYNTYHGKCTRGPEIVLRKAFDMEMIGKKSNQGNIINIMSKQGFKLKFYGKLHHEGGSTRNGGINKNKSLVYENIPTIIKGVKLQVGDVAYTDGGAGHWAIWSGKAWVSDCWQPTMAVHPNVTENFWVWSYQCSSYPIDVTPNGNSKIDCPYYNNYKGMNNSNWGKKY